MKPSVLHKLKEIKAHFQSKKEEKVSEADIVENLICQLYVLLGLDKKKKK